MIVCAGDRESFEFATPIGVGLLDSAINLTRICLMNPPEFILFIGTAGSYGEKEIFDIVESKSATHIENSFFNAGAYTPIDNVISTATDIESEVLVNSSNYITTDKTLGKYYLSHNIGIENMEFFAVAKVAKEFDIPMGGVFIITNYCNANAHQDFKANHAEAMKRLSEYMKQRG
ncbi:MAG: purine-nucleoside phosphorylase [Campylobacterales bacterium]|nr:purine-nucleoside phosphorylase [Campylobacterales bacterium]